MSNPRFVRVTIRQWVYGNGTAISISSKRGELKFSGPNRIALVERLVNAGTGMKLVLTPLGEFAVVLSLPTEVLEVLKTLNKLKHPISQEEVAKLAKGDSGKAIRDFVCSRMLLEE